MLPSACQTILQQALQSGNCLDSERLFVALQSHLLQDQSTLENIYQVNHGIERRLSLAALKASSFAELAEDAKSRQWTLTRMQRILIYVLMQAASAEMQAFVQAGPLYLRLLGNSEKGRKVLARVRKGKTLPLIADPARASHTLRKFYRGNEPLGRLAESMLQYDLRATQLYSLLQVNPAGEYRNRDYYEAVRQAGCGSR